MTNNANFLFTDTDSLCYGKKTQDFYQDISDDVYSTFDTSNFREHHPSGIPTGVNKKVVGVMKDEAWGNQTTEFVGLRSKLYAYKVGEGNETKKCKGVKKGIVKKYISFEDYKKCFCNREEQQRSMNTFRSRKHNIYTETVTKIALSASDDKRYVIPDDPEHKTLAQGHYLIAGAGI